MIRRTSKRTVGFVPLLLALLCAAHPPFLSSVDAFSMMLSSSTTTTTRASTAVSSTKQLSKNDVTKASMFSQHTNAHTPTTEKITLTYLEINGWLLTMNNGMTVLIDPILEGPLDFGIPDIFKGSKRVLPTTGLTDILPLQDIDCLLLTQGLEDHAHVQTLTKLWSCDKFPKDVPIVAPPSAKAALEDSGWYGSTSNIRFIDHGQETLLIQQGDKVASNPAPLSIKATAGALVGPPWQRRENGYILSCASSTTDPTKRPISLYIEPHVEFNPNELSEYAPVDVVITPTTGQTLPAFELVHGPKDSLRLMDTLRPRFVVPMANADIDTSGWAAPLVTTVGSPADFARGVVMATQRRRSSNSNGSSSRDVVAAAAAPTIVPVEPGKDIVLELES